MILWKKMGIFDMLVVHLNFGKKWVRKPKEKKKENEKNRRK